MLQSGQVAPERAPRARGHPTLDAGQLERLYERYVVPIYRFIYARVGNREDSEDITSRVFMKSLDYVDPTADPREIEAYLYQIARTNLAEHWRRYAALRVVSMEEMPPAFDVPAAETEPETGPPVTETLAGELERVLSMLPPRYRRVIELRFCESLSIKETARAMQITEANAKVLQFRAIQRAAALARGEGAHP